MKKTIAFASVPISLLALSGCGSHPAGRDHGAASTDYPATHAAPPDVGFYGGPIQDAPVFYAVTVAGDPLESQITDFVSRAGGSAWWSAAVGSYGVGAGTFGGTVHIPSPPSTITGDQLKGIVNGMLDGTHPEFGTPSLNADYIVFLPDGVTISDPNGTSCVDYGAYHGSLYVSGGPYDGAEVTYSAVPRCNFGLPSIDDLTIATSHEMAEAATDPSVEDGRLAWYGFADDGAWNVLFAGEVGDMCDYAPDPFIRPAELGYLVQRVWSRSAAAAGHDPCQPASDVYFEAAPLLTDTVAIPSFGANAPAIRIPVGGSKTIELDLFSDSDTGGEFTVSAEDGAPLYGLPANLSFTLDRDHGVNGEKVWLTVHVDSEGQYSAFGIPNAEFFYLRAKRGATEQLWPVMVSNDAAP